MSDRNVPRVIAALATVVGFGVGCSSAEARSGLEAVGTTTEPTTSVQASSVDSSQTAEPEVTGIVRPEDARALITSTGVIVSVQKFSDGRYVVTTPCGNEAALAWGTAIATADVVLDPGHGGDVETGAVGPSGLVERDINLIIAKRTAVELADRQISAVLTRTGDYRMPLAVRALIANELDAAALVSIHHNAPEVAASPTPGTEIFVQQGRAESRRLGGTIYDAVFAALDTFDVEWQAASDAGVLAVINRDDEDSYGMIRRPEMPAVLVELGYIANPAEEALFATDAYVESVSVAMADGIESWMTTADAGRGFVDEPRRFTPDGGSGGSSGCVDPALE